MSHSENAEISNLNKELSETPYELLLFLGIGSFGKVFQGFDKKLRRNCAIKVYIKGEYKKNLQEIIYDEANLLQTLNHPNIVKFYNLYETKNRIFLVMELISGGSLKTLLEKRKEENKSLNEEELRKLMQGIINAVRYLHENEIVHRDLKPENILLSESEDFSTVKIIDFGLSVKFNDVNKNLYLKCGTPLFIAPELKKYNIYSKPVDIWSCGIIFYGLCTLGEHPFYKKENKKDFQNQQDFIVNLPNEIPPLIANLLIKMLATEPSERYNAENVAQHPFIIGKNQADIPLSLLDSIKAFQNQDNLINVLKMIFFCKYFEKLSPKVAKNENLKETPISFRISTKNSEINNKKEKLKLNPLIISEKYHSPSKDKSAGSRVSTSKSKGKSPLIWHNEETKHEKGKTSFHNFSFNHHDLENDLGVRRIISDLKENEKVSLMNESNHIDGIIRNKNKHKSALLRPDIKISFKIKMSTSDGTDESNDSFLKNAANNEERTRFPLVKPRIQSFYSNSPIKKKNK